MKFIRSESIVVCAIKISFCTERYGIVSGLNGNVADLEMTVGAEQNVVHSRPGII